MKIKLLGYMLVLSFFILTGCEKDIEPSPDQINELQELKETQNEKIQLKIDEITKRLEALQTEGTVEDEEPNNDKKDEPINKVDADTQPNKTNENSDEDEAQRKTERDEEISALLQELAELKEAATETLGADTTPVTDERDPSDCTFNGETLTHGQSKNYYNNQTVPHGSSCQGEVRVCNNGVMSGNSSYQYSACLVSDAIPAATVETDASCNFGGETLAHGQSKTYYQDQSVPHGNSCQSQERSCNNGTMEGNVNYQYANCSVEAAPVVATANCSLSGVTVNHGNSGFFYTSSTVPFGTTCSTVRQERTCDNGTLSGDNSYDEISCVVEAEVEAGGVDPGDFEAPDLGIPDGIFDEGRRIPDFQMPKSNCTLDGTTITHNTSKIFYAKKSVNIGQSCNDYRGGRTCIDGDLSGDAKYKYASCSVSTGAIGIPDGGGIIGGGVRVPDGLAPGDLTMDACSLDGITVTHGSSHNFYDDDEVPFSIIPGNSCSNHRQSRTCNNGTLSGSNNYKYSSCVIESMFGDNCYIDGDILYNGIGREFYDRSIAGDCSTHKQFRRCDEGVISGNYEYKFRECTTLNMPALGDLGGFGETLDCTLDSIDIEDGESHTFYSRTAAPLGGVCSSYDQIRTCTDGTLSGSANYKYANCTGNMVIPGGTIPSGVYTPLTPVAPIVPITPTPIVPIKIPTPIPGL